MAPGRRPTEIERYEQFFGFGEPPFSLAPDPRYFFESSSHGAALAQAASAIERREPLVVITGDTGSGKTLLCRTVLQRLDRRTLVSVVNNPQLRRDDLLEQLLEGFGLISKDRPRPLARTRHDLVHALENFLASLAALKAHAVVIIDEAQHVQPDALEQIRLLSHVDGELGTMLQMILVGPPDLERLLSRAELRQFQQRVTRRCHLEPLSPGELRPYVEHRLAVARSATASKLPGADALARAIEEWGPFGTGVAFTPDSFQALWRFSGGLPRVVNILCHRALEAACARRARTVDAAAVSAAALALNLPGIPPALEPPPARGVDDEEIAPVLDPAPPDVLSGGRRIPMPAPEALGPSPARRDAVDDREIASMVDRAPKEPSSGGRRIAMLAAATLAGLAIWFGAHALTGRVDRRQIAPRGPEPMAAAPADRSAPAHAPNLAPETPGALAAPAAEASLATREGTGGERVEIIVASFRTEARAASVMTAVSGLGLPVRLRAAAGWQQIVTGPFGSRAEAGEARQRLERAGLVGTQTVPADRRGP